MKKFTFILLMALSVFTLSNCAQDATPVDIPVDLDTDKVSTITSLEYEDVISGETIYENQALKFRIKFSPDFVWKYYESLMAVPSIQSFYILDLDQQEETEDTAFLQIMSITLTAEEKVGVLADNMQNSKDQSVAGFEMILGPDFNLIELNDIKVGDKPGFEMIYTVISDTDFYPKTMQKTVVTDSSMFIFTYATANEEDFDYYLDAVNESIESIEEI